MHCPKCGNSMRSVEIDGVEIDRCVECGGIWLDVGESELLSDSETATAIDTGDPLKGRETNLISRYRCPRCGGGMMRAVDPRRPGISYEECTSCKGTFFDAGEFADRSLESVPASIKNKT